MSDADPAERVFEAPWQAQAFALVVALNERGLLEWGEWTRYLGESLARGQCGPAQGAIGSGSSGYYLAWLEALERFVRDSGLVAPLALGARREALRAYGRVAVDAQALRISRAQSPTSDGPR